VPFHNEDVESEDVQDDGAEHQQSDPGGMDGVGASFKRTMSEMATKMKPSRPPTMLDAIFIGID